jgi:integrase
MEGPPITRQGIRHGSWALPRLGDGRRLPERFAHRLCADSCRGDEDGGQHDERPRVFRRRLEHRDVQKLERDFAGDAYADADLVFADALGGTVNSQRLTEQFRTLRKAAGLPTGTLHVLRHTAATLALTEGVPVHIVAARLGDDPKTVLSVYSHLLPSRTSRRPSE